MLRKSPLKRSGRLKPASKKRVKLNREYMARREAYLESNPICEFWLAENGWFRAEGIEPRYNHGPLDYGSRTADFLRCYGNAPSSTEVHHKKGRGKYLLDTSTWMAVSADGHRYIHKNVKESYSKGYLLNRN